MTPTPRTDGAEWHTRTPGNPVGMDVVASSFARQLERELEEAKREISEMRLSHHSTKTRHHYLAQITELQDQLTAHKAALDKCKSVLTSIRRGEYSGGIDEALTAINELKEAKP